MITNLTNRQSDKLLNSQSYNDRSKLKNFNHLIQERVRTHLEKKWYYLTIAYKYVNWQMMLQIL